MLLVNDYEPSTFHHSAFSSKYLAILEVFPNNSLAFKGEKIVFFSLFFRNNSFLSIPSPPLRVLPQYKCTVLVLQPLAHNEPYSCRRHLGRELSDICFRPTHALQPARGLLYRACSMGLSSSSRRESSVC